MEQGLLHQLPINEEGGQIRLIMEEWFDALALQTALEQTENRAEQCSALTGSLPS